MKLVRSISLFIVCIGLFIIGYFVGMEYQSFFYPGRVESDNIAVLDTDQGYVCADTIWEVHEIYVDSNHEVISSMGNIHVDSVPEKYLGMNLGELTEQINQMNTLPPLSELKNGLDYMCLNSFSSKKVELFKYYLAHDSVSKDNQENAYYLAIFNHHVIVYKSDQSTVFMNTNIKAETLPEEVRSELLKKKPVRNEKELYAFLESYSS